MTTSLHHYGGPGATPAITVRRRGRLNDDIATPRLFTWSSIAAPKDMATTRSTTADVYKEPPLKTNLDRATTTM
jgi:hypothetical protein